MTTETREGRSKSSPHQPTVQMSVVDGPSVLSPADALLAHLREGAYDDLLSLLRCDRCGAVSTEWYDMGAGIEAFCECSPGNGAYHGWYRRYDAKAQS